MITFDEEMNKWLDLFYQQFHDIVPLMQIPGKVGNEQLIDAIKKSLEAKENLLPAIFGYGENSRPNILY
jgi:hypothetical protein